MPISKVPGCPDTTIYYCSTCAISRLITGKGDCHSDSKDADLDYCQANSIVSFSSEGGC